MSVPSSSPLIVQGRWAWRALLLVLPVSAFIVWRCTVAAGDAEWEARYFLSREAPRWSFIHAFTGRTVGR